MADFPDNPTVGDKVDVKGTIYEWQLAQFWKIVANTNVAPNPIETNFTLVGDGAQLEKNLRYFSTTNSTLTLPDYTTLIAGDVVEVAKSQNITVFVESFNSQEIVSDISMDTSVEFNLLDDVLFLYDGVRWNLLYSGRGGQPEIVINNENYIVAQDGETLEIDKRYLLIDDYTVFLPNYVALNNGVAIVCSKVTGKQPIIEAQTGQSISTDIGSDSSITFDSTDEVIFAYDGDSWELMFGGNSGN